MKPIKFKYQNTVYSKNQSEYQELPSLKLDTAEGEVISCWKLSFKERIIVLITGKIWLSLMSFNNPLTPSFLSTKRKEVFTVLNDNLTIKEKIKNYFNRF